jgi:peptidoglycan/xylan/chitin deacetylase (PgdA/CDA1 family)
MTPIPVLLYHSVDTRIRPEYRRWCVPTSVFDEHLDVIAAGGYTCLTVSELADHLRLGTLPSKPLVISFDDGRLDFVDNALPALERHRMPATIYVVSGHIGATSSWLPFPAERNEPMMDWADLRSLSAAGVECGAHSHTHPELDTLSRADARSEIERSRRVLEDGLGAAVRSFAYPFGYHSASVLQATIGAGFESACAVKNRWSSDVDDPFAISRLIVEGTCTAEELNTLISTPPNSIDQRPALLGVGWRCVRRARRLIGARP